LCPILGSFLASIWGLQSLLLRHLLNAAMTVDHLTPAAELLPSSPKDSITVDEFFGGYDGAVPTSPLIGHHLSIDYLLGFTAVLSTPTQAKPTPQDQHSMTAASQASLAVALGCVGSACIVQSFTIPFVPTSQTQLIGASRICFSPLQAVFALLGW